MTEPAREAREIIHIGDLADQIYDAITSDASVAEALRVWRFHHKSEESRRMWLVLQSAIAIAIDRVRCARRVRRGET